MALSDRRNFKSSSSSIKMRFNLCSLSIWFIWKTIQFFKKIQSQLKWNSILVDERDYSEIGKNYAVRINTFHQIYWATVISSSLPKVEFLYLRRIPLLAFWKKTICPLPSYFWRTTPKRSMNVLDPFLPAAWPVEREQLQRRQNGSNLI